MKITILAAAALALGLTAAPALAQPPGHDMHGDMRHGDNDRHDRDMRRDDNDRHHDWNRGHHYGWDRGHHYGWNNHRRHCRWIWRHHHRQRVCYR